MAAAEIMQPGAKPARGTYALLLNGSLDRQNINERLTLPHSKIQKSNPITDDESNELLYPAREETVLAHSDSFEEEFYYHGFPSSSAANPAIRHSAVGQRNVIRTPVHHHFQASPAGLPVPRNQSLKRKEPDFSHEGREVAPSGKRTKFENKATGSSSQPLQSRFPGSGKAAADPSRTRGLGTKTAGPSSLRQQAKSSSRPGFKKASADPFCAQRLSVQTQGHGNRGVPLPNLAPISRQLMPKSREGSSGESDAPPKKKVRGPGRTPKYLSHFANTFTASVYADKELPVLSVTQAKPTFGVFSVVEKMEPPPKPSTTKTGGKTTRRIGGQMIEVASNWKPKTMPAAPRTRNRGHYHPDTAAPSVERDSPVIDSRTLAESFHARVLNPMDVGRNIAGANRIASQINIGADGYGGYIDAERALASRYPDQTRVYPPSLGSNSRPTSTHFQSFNSRQPIPTVGIPGQYPPNSTYNPRSTSAFRNERVQLLDPAEQYQYMTYAIVGEQEMTARVEHGFESNEAARAYTADSTGVFDYSQAVQQIEENAEDDDNRVSNPESLRSGFPAALQHAAEDTEIGSNDSFASSEDNGNTLYDPDSPGGGSPVTSWNAKDTEIGGSGSLTASKEISPAVTQEESDNAIEAEFALLLGEPEQQVGAYTSDRQSSDNLIGSSTSTEVSSVVTQEESDNAIEAEFASLLGEPEQEVSADTIDQQSSDDLIDQEFAALLAETPQQVAETEPARFAEQISTSPEATDSNRPSSRQKSTMKRKQATSAAQEQTSRKRLSVSTSRPSVAIPASHDNTLHINKTSQHFLGGRKYTWMSTQTGEDDVYNRVPKSSSSKKKYTGGTTTSAKNGPTRAQKEVIVIDSDDNNDDMVASHGHQSNNRTGNAKQPCATLNIPDYLAGPGTATSYRSPYQSPATSFGASPTTQSLALGFDNQLAQMKQSRLNLIFTSRRYDVATLRELKAECVRRGIHMIKSNKLHKSEVIAYLETYDAKRDAEIAAAKSQPTRMEVNLGLDKLADAMSNAVGGGRTRDARAGGTILEQEEEEEKDDEEDCEGDDEESNEEDEEDDLFA